MSNGLSVVDVVAAAQEAAASEMQHMPMTRGSLQVAARDASGVRTVKFTIEIVGMRRRFPVSIDVDVEDGRTSETADSIKNRLVAEILDKVGTRAP